jgi:hypothetical protein
MPQVRVLGIDMAQQIVHVVGLDEAGNSALRKRLPRGTRMPLMAQMPPLGPGWKPVEAPIIGRGPSANMGIP